MPSLINKLHGSQFLGKIFHTLDYELVSSLKDCESVLDVGCGPSSPLQHCKNIKMSVGVEAFKPYLEESKRKKIHTKYLNKKIEELEFPDKSFDAVIAIEVIEHLPKKTALEFLKKASRWAKKKVVISTPNGYFPMNDVDENKYQRHLSGWEVSELSKLGFKVTGLAGLKAMYKSENSVDTIINNSDSIYSNIKYQPKKLFYIFNAFIQVFSSFFPNYSFELFGVKNV